MIPRLLSILHFLTFSHFQLVRTSFCIRCIDDNDEEFEDEAFLDGHAAELRAAWARRLADYRWFRDVPHIEVQRTLSSRYSR